MALKAMLSYKLRLLCNKDMLFVKLLCALHNGGSSISLPSVFGFWGPLYKLWKEWVVKKILKIMNGILFIVQQVSRWEGTWILPWLLALTTSHLKIEGASAWAEHAVDICDIFCAYCFCLTAMRRGMDRRELPAAWPCVIGGNHSYPWPGNSGLVSIVLYPLHSLSEAYTFLPLCHGFGSSVPQFPPLYNRDNPYPQGWNWVWFLNPQKPLWDFVWAKQGLASTCLVFLCLKHSHPVTVWELGCKFHRLSDNGRTRSRKNKREELLSFWVPHLASARNSNGYVTALH